MRWKETYLQPMQEARGGPEGLRVSGTIKQRKAPQRTRVGHYQYQALASSNWQINLHQTHLANV